MLSTRPASVLFRDAKGQILPEQSGVLNRPGLMEALIPREDQAMPAPRCYPRELRGLRERALWGMAWSPEQISRGLRVDFPDGESMRIPHEAINQAQYVRDRGALEREVGTCFRTCSAVCVPEARSRRGKKFIASEVMISARTAEVEHAAIPGHREGDLYIGLDRSVIGPFVERTTRYSMLLHMVKSLEVV